MAKKPTTIDEYLADVAEPLRGSLEKIWQVIRSAVPDAVECINYGVPAFRLDGVSLVGFGAAAKHGAFFPMDGSTTGILKADLRGYDTSKGAIRFPPEKPLPAALVRKIIKHRLSVLAARSKKPASSKSTKPSPKSPVDDFMRTLRHPLAKDFAEVRKLILSASPDIHEGIKWNAPSFSTADYFATFFLRTEDTVQLIFHTGAKKKNVSMQSKVADPHGLAQWLAKDRCMVTLGAGKEIQANRKSFIAFVRDWIERM
jgi:uncharacterized protein YdhG (YjbR/CyaY superfamily)